MRRFVAIMLVLILLVVWTLPGYRLVRIGNYEFYMADGYTNYEAAAELINAVNLKIMSILKFLKTKYADPTAPNYDLGPANSLTPTRMVLFLLANYNPESIYETDPRWTNDTSYMINKGHRFHICLRDKSAPNQLVPLNDLLFIVLHEISHIAAYNVSNHPEEYWQVFKFILQEAQESGIYIPADYHANPIKYCGLGISYNPLFDSNIKNLA
jgi:hypothetical protein